MGLSELQFAPLRKRELAKVISSPLEILALFSTVFEYFMCDFIDYEVLYIIAQTHNLFHWLSFENGKAFKCKSVQVSSVWRFHSGLGSLGQARPSVTPDKTTKPFIQLFSPWPNVFILPFTVCPFLPFSARAHARALRLLVSSWCDLYLSLLAEVTIYIIFGIEKSKKKKMTYIKSSAVIRCHLCPNVTSTPEIL